MTAIQAPSANFETTTTTSVMPVATAPTALIHSERRCAPAPTRRQCCTMPACESVNARNAPIGEERDQPIGDAAEHDEEQRRRGAPGR